MPVFTLEGLAFVANFALTKRDLRFGSCLNASIGGFGKIFLRVGSRIMVFQCVFKMFETLVRQGWSIFGSNIYS